MTSTPWTAPHSRPEKWPLARTLAGPLLRLAAVADRALSAAIDSSIDDSVELAVRNAGVTRAVRRDYGTAPGHPAQGTSRAATRRPFPTPIEVAAW